MRVDVVLGPQQLAQAEVTGRVVGVIDVLRASTTIAVALAHGARAVIPLESSDEVVQAYLGLALTFMRHRPDGDAARALA